VPDHDDHAGAGLLAGERAGSGEPLLLLHGIGTTRADFATLIPRLAGRYDVLAVDLPGHGGSPPLGRGHTVAALAGAVEADLDARGLGTVHVLGNSLGGRIALELARRGRARSVVALAPSGLALPAERVAQASLLAGGHLALRALRGVVPALAGPTITRAALMGPLRAWPWAATATEARALGEGLGGAARFWETLAWTVLADLPRGLDAIGCPVTLVQGGLDPVAPGHAARYLPLVPGARLRWIPDAGHAAHGDHPGITARIVRETTEPVARR
jgi:pimeloyl-ACP methyl ester carboxylesterase